MLCGLRPAAAYILYIYAGAGAVNYFASPPCVATGKCGQ